MIHPTDVTDYKRSRERASVACLPLGDSGTDMLNKKPALVNAIPDEDVFHVGGNADRSERVTIQSLDAILQSLFEFIGKARWFVVFPVETRAFFLLAGRP